MRNVKYILVALLMATVFYGRAIAADGDKYNDGVNRVNSDGAVIHSQNIAEATGVTVSYKYDLYTNAGCSAATIWTLPAAEAGTEIVFYLEKAFDMDINPANSAIIGTLTNAVGDALSSDVATGSSVTLRAVSATKWIVLDRQGTWTDTN